MSIKRLPSLARDRLPAAVESILFVADEPVAVSLLGKALRRPLSDVEAALAAVEERCAAGGMRLQRTGDRVQLVTAPEYGPFVERFLGLESRQRLSSAALESLAIIAYRQPLTRAAVEQLRGVNSDGAIASLIARGLVEEVGRAPGPGRPSLLGTTLRFLEHFGLSKPSDLPPLAIESSPRDDEDSEGLDAEAVNERAEEPRQEAAAPA